MYSIVYTKKAAGDIPKLKAARLDKKAKALIDLLRENPYQTPPPYEKLVGNLKGAYSKNSKNPQPLDTLRLLTYYAEKKKVK